MAAIHGLNIPVSKEPEWLWKTMERWLLSSETVLATFESSSANETRLCADMRSFDFRAELDWLKRTIEAEDYAVVFSHNDLQEGNILFREDSVTAAAAAAAAATAVIQSNNSSSCGNSSPNDRSSPMERIQYARQPSKNGLHDFSVVSSCRPVTSTTNMATAKTTSAAIAGSIEIDEYACNSVDLDQLPCDGATGSDDVLAATR